MPQRPPLLTSGARSDPVPRFTLYVRPRPCHAPSFLANPPFSFLLTEACRREDSPSYTGHNTSPHPLRTAHTDPPNHTADPHKRQHARATPFRHHEKLDDQRCEDADRHPYQETRSDEEMLEAFDGGDGLLFGGVESEDGGAEDAEDAAYPALVCISRATYVKWKSRGQDPDSEGKGQAGRTHEEGERL